MKKKIFEKICSNKKENILKVCLNKKKILKKIYTNKINVIFVHFLWGFFLKKFYSELS